jgi:hypothetical protein
MACAGVEAANVGKWTHGFRLRQFRCGGCRHDNVRGSCLCGGVLWFTITDDLPQFSEMRRSAMI